MKSFSNFSLLTLIILSFVSCKQPKESVITQEEHRKTIEMVTNYGTMVIELYNETPLHRDNFINLVTHHAYDSLLFHRVINKFMIQGGDPDSRNVKPDAELGNGDAPYVVDAEVNMKSFHKKGALAAAREDHPEKASSAMQFYIVQGLIHNDSLLDKAEQHTNKLKARDYYRNVIEKKPLLDSINAAMETRNRDRYTVLTDSILASAKTEDNFTTYVMPKNYREVYKSIGGYPRLDQNYTVFGEVIKGIEVIDSIAKVKTNPADRPIEDVRIKTIRLIN
jgi:peptidyl-prolyl cis-trans isomerase B (cyclophilin B)